MILKKITGCIANSLTADNVEEIDMTPEQKQDTINHICAWIQNHPEELNQVMQSMIEAFGDCDMSDTPCECCGDFIVTETWAID